MQLTVLQPSVSGEPVESTSIKTLIKDPYILIAAGEKTINKFLIDSFRIK